MRDQHREDIRQARYRENKERLDFLRDRGSLTYSEVIQGRFRIHAKTRGGRETVVVYHGYTSEVEHLNKKVGFGLNRALRILGVDYLYLE